MKVTDEQRRARLVSRQLASASTPEGVVESVLALHATDPVVENPAARIAQLEYETETRLKSVGTHGLRSITGGQAASPPSTTPTVAENSYLGDYKPPLFDTFSNIGPTIRLDRRIVGGWAVTPAGGVATELFEGIGSNTADVTAEAERSQHSSTAPPS